MRNVRDSHTSLCPVETLTQCTKSPSLNSVNNRFLRFLQDCNAVVIEDERLDCWVSTVLDQVGLVNNWSNLGSVHRRFGAYKCIPLLSSSKMKACFVLAAKVLVTRRLIVH